MTLFFRVNEHEEGSLNMYAAISSLFNSSRALGAMLGPPAAGLISQHMGFPWAATITAFAQSFMVSEKKQLTTLFTNFQSALFIISIKLP